MPVRFGDARAFTTDSTPVTHTSRSTSTILSNIKIMLTMPVTRNNAQNAIARPSNASLKFAIDIAHTTGADNVVYNNLFTKHTSATSSSTLKSQASLSDNQPNNFNLYLFGFKIVILLIVICALFIFLDKIRRWWCVGRKPLENETLTTASQTPNDINKRTNKQGGPKQIIPLPDGTLLPSARSILPLNVPSIFSPTTLTTVPPSAPMLIDLSDNKSEYCSLHTIYEEADKIKLEEKKKSTVYV